MSAAEEDTPHNAKVQSLFGDPIASPGDPDPDVVKALEEMLEEARSGTLTGLGLAAVYHDGSTASNWCGCVETASLVGALELAKAKAMKGSVENEC